MVFFSVISSEEMSVYILLQPKDMTYQMKIYSKSLVGEVFIFQGSV